MKRRTRSNKKAKKSKKIFLSVMLLFFILSASFILINKLPVFFDRVLAGGFEEEENNSINEEIPSTEEDEEDEEDVIGTDDEIKETKDENPDEVDKDPKGDLSDSNDQTQNNQNEKQLVSKADDILIVVNKVRYLAKEYKPSDLVVPNISFSFDGDHEKKHMRREAANAIEELFKQAKEEGAILYAVSGYRSYATQERIFKNKVSSVGEDAANLLVARPGESEHQTGLAMDVTSNSAQLSLAESFGNTAEGKWVKDNAHRFGFIIRYLENKTEITGYSYEPWHIRYVGKGLAEKLYNEGITLEEYFDLE